MDVVELQAAVGSLLAPGGREDPYPLYARLHADGRPVHALGPQYVIVTGYQVAQQVLRDPTFWVQDRDYHDRTWPEWRNYPSIAAFASSMLLANSPVHERMRGLVSRAFTARRVAEMAPAVERLAVGLVESMAQRAATDGVADFMSEFAFLLPVTVICELLGIPEADRAWFRPLVAELTVVLEMTITEAAIASADKAVDDLAGYFGALIAQRRADPKSDLISALVSARDGGDSLDDAELLGNLVLLLAAGFETTTNLLGNGVAVLMAEPALADRLRGQPDLVAAFTEEVLRYDSPVQLTGRLATAGTTLAGVPVAAGTIALVLLGAANRDPAQFDDPDRFDVDRNGEHPLSFGSGAHYCLGAALARMEAAIAFPILLGRFARIEPAGPSTRRERLTLRGYETLPVAVVQAR